MHTTHRSCYHKIKKIVIFRSFRGFVKRVNHHCCINLTGRPNLKHMRLNDSYYAAIVTHGHKTQLNKLPFLWKNNINTEESKCILERKILNCQNLNKLCFVDKMLMLKLQGKFIYIFANTQNPSLCLCVCDKRCCGLYLLVAKRFSCHCRIRITETAEDKK